MKRLIGSADILFLTLDTLRFDAAQQAWQEGKLKTLAPYLGQRGWEKRHTPGSFTYAAHHAFLAGFLPTPVGPGPHPRLFAAEFGGSLTTVESTFVFQEATLPQALAARGYHTICIGGTGFFNQQNELARVGAAPAVCTAIANVSLPLGLIVDCPSTRLVLVTLNPRAWMGT